MAHLATDQNAALGLAHRALAATGTVLRALGNFFAVIGRASTMQALMTASDAELAARGITRQQIVDYIIEGRQPR